MSNRAFHELQRTEWRVFVALARSEPPASARAVREDLERLGFKLDANAVRDYLSKCVAKGYARAVAPPANAGQSRSRGRPAKLYFVPTRKLRPAVEAQFRRWLEEWAIPEAGKEWIASVLSAAAPDARRRFFAAGRATASGRGTGSS